MQPQQWSTQHRKHRSRHSAWEKDSSRQQCQSKENTAQHHHRHAPAQQQREQQQEPRQQHKSLKAIGSGEKPSCKPTTQAKHCNSSKHKNRKQLQHPPFTTCTTLAVMRNNTAPETPEQNAEARPAVGKQANGTHQQHSIARICHRQSVRVMAHVQRDTILIVSHKVHTVSPLGIYVVH